MIKGCSTHIAWRIGGSINSSRTHLEIQVTSHLGLQCLWRILFPASCKNSIKSKSATTIDVARTTSQSSVSTTTAQNPATRHTNWSTLQLMLLTDFNCIIIMTSLRVGTQDGNLIDQLSTQVAPIGVGFIHLLI